ncbi:hypothetical protein Bca52824_017913 [Brassica carinata]|uniref:AP2/ERF domain-containing protein n=1 Tax=Brassica carinata TaxID=52824 RepID=A0A8X7VNR9_BRACI|nr:hypothetical protein Bca52824_017913 [Brassica carinata]
MAAAAYDAAALHLRGRGTHLNFPELADSFPRPESSSSEHVQVAAQEESLMFKPGGSTEPDIGSGQGLSRVGLSPDQIQAINEFPLDSLRMGWMQDLEVNDYEELYRRYFEGAAHRPIPVDEPENGDTVPRKTRTHRDSDSEMEDEEYSPDNPAITDPAMAAYLEKMFSEKFNTIQSRVERLPGVSSSHPKK